MPARVVVTLAGLAVLALSALATTAASRDAAAPSPVGYRHSPTSRSYAIAVTVAVLIAPAVYHHYLALLVLPMLLALGAGVPVRWVAVEYFLMWGGQQTALGDLAWVVNRGLPTAGALLLLVGLLFSRTRPTAASRSPARSSIEAARTPSGPTG